MSSTPTTTTTTVPTTTTPTFTPERLVKFVLRALEWHMMLVCANKKENTDPQTPFAIARALVLGGLCEPGCMVPPLWCDLGLTKEESEALMEQINKCSCMPCQPNAGMWNSLMYNSWYANNSMPNRATNMLQQIAAQAPYCPPNPYCGFPVLNLPKTTKKSACKK